VRPRTIHLLVIAGTGLLFTLPHALFGFIGGHDIVPHLQWSTHFSSQLLSGELYPRWLLDMNSGYGSPTFFYYGPVPYYITSLFHALLGPSSGGWMSLGLSCSLALALSGIAAYEWLRGAVDGTAALIGALFYMLMPYHLAIDVYVRFAFAEQWAFVWMPVVMHFTRQLTRGSGSAFFGLSAATAALAMTHLPTTMVFAPVPLLFSLCVPGSRRFQAAARTALGMSAGLGLAAVYLLPALTTQGDVSMESMWRGNYSYDRNFLFMGTSGLKKLLNLTALLTTLAALCAVGLSEGADDRRERRFWLVAVLVTLFLMTPLSTPVWGVLPPLQKIQFPWRLCSLLALGAAALLGQARLANRRGAARNGALAKLAIILIIGISGLFIARDVQVGLKYLAPGSSRVDIPPKDRPEYRPRWSTTFSELAGGFRNSPSQVRLLGDLGNAELKRREPRRIEVAYTSATEDSLEVDQFYYPGWTARIRGEDAPLPLEASSPDGLVRIDVPSGTHEVVLVLESRGAEKAGWVVSALTAFLLAALALRRRFRVAASAEAAVASGIATVPAPAPGEERLNQMMGLSARELRERALRLWDALITTQSRLLPVIVIGLQLVVSVATNRFLLRDFPNSADEYSYFVMAQTFAEGKLSVASPEPREFFNFIHIVNDGRYYGKYEPGWPAILTLGVLLGSPGLVNPILGALALAAMYVIARRFFSIEVANLSLVLSVFNPFLAFNSASYFGHPACLLCITLFLGALLAWLKDPASKGAPVLAGTAAGIAFLIRPFTAAVVVAPALVYLVARLLAERQGRRLLRGLALAMVPLALSFALGLFYNHLQTGDAWVSPRLKYADIDRPSLSGTFANLGERMNTHFVQRLWSLAQWLPLSPIFIALYLGLRRTRANRAGLIFIFTLAALVVSHLFYSGRGGNRYGPRHYYEATAALLIVAASVVAAVGRPGILMVAGVLLMNGVLFKSSAEFYSKLVEERLELFDLAEEQKLSNAIVFLRTGSATMPRGDLTRNGIHFDGPILYVMDRGAENQKLLERYPTRQPYLFEWDRARKCGQLTPLEPR